MFKSNEKEKFLKSADQAREKRLLEKKRLNAVLKIQAFFRGHLTRKHLYNNLE